KDLPCLFKFLTEDYPGSELAKCETLEKKRWRHADSPMVENKAKTLVKYLPKLSPLLGSLNDYSVCQKHYNNIIIKNFFLEQIEKIVSPNFCDFGIQVSLPNPEYESLIKKINELERLNQQLLLENEMLKKKLNNKYDNQQERVKAVVEIAKRERNALNAKFGKTPD
ncbi:17025_t:CDS:2, partial [Gigaspora rosea]